MLFAGYDYYPSGGWEDFKGYFDSIEDAKNYLLRIEMGHDSWMHIVEEGEIIMNGITNGYLKSREVTWVFKEVKK